VIGTHFPKLKAEVFGKNMKNSRKLQEKERESFTIKLILFADTEAIKIQENS